VIDMPKPKRSYKDLEAEILRLREQQEALKEAKVEIFLREFRKKSFQEKLLDVDDAVLKKVAREYVSAFDTFVERAGGCDECSTSGRAEAAEQPSVPAASFGGMNGFGAG